MQVISVIFRPDDFHAGIDLSAFPKLADETELVQYKYQWHINGEPNPWLQEPILPGDAFKKGDRIAVEVTPYTRELEGKPCRTREIVVPNAPPQFTSLPPDLHPDQLYRYAAKASDPDGDEIAFYLKKAPEGMVVDAGSGDVTWAGFAGQKGEKNIELVARDPDGGEALQRFSFAFPDASESNE
jgi:hypothetical protein